MIEPVYKIKCAFLEKINPLSPVVSNLLVKFRGTTVFGPVKIEKEVGLQRSNVNAHSLWICLFIKSTQRRSHVL